MLRYLSYNKLPYHGFSQKSCGVAVNSPGNITLSKYLLFTGIFFMESCSIDAIYMFSS